MNRIADKFSPAPQMIISVTAPVSPAFDYMKTVLFRPFNLEKWLTLGFCAFLAALGTGGGMSGYHNGFGNSNNNLSFEEVKQWVLENLDWIIPAAAGAIILIIGLWILLTWLNSRGQFMLLSGVALNRGEVKHPWARYSAHATSLFFFKLVLGVVSFLLILPLLGLVGFLVSPVFSDGHLDRGAVFGTILLGLAAAVLGILTVIIQILTDAFVVPIMYLKTPRCMEAWREFSGLLSNNAGHFILYLLFLLLMKIGAHLAAIILGVLTCCIGCCLMSIPYIGTVLLLPLAVFFRSYSLLFLSQFGGQYNVWQPPHSG